VDNDSCCDDFGYSSADSDVPPDEQIVAGIINVTEFRDEVREVRNVASNPLCPPLLQILSRALTRLLVVDIPATKVFPGILVGQVRVKSQSPLTRVAPSTFSSVLERWASASIRFFNPTMDVALNDRGSSNLIIVESRRFE